MKPRRIAPIFLAVVSACFALPASAGEAGGTYTYTNFGVPDGACGVFEVGTEGQRPAATKTVIDTTLSRRRHPHPRGTYFGCHTRTALLQCEDTLYYCFRTAATHFAVPKERGLHVGQRWATMENTFEVIRKEDIAYLGKRFETFVLATPNKRGGTAYFYWSEGAGLLAIRYVTQLEGKEYVDAMVVETTRGFPF